MKRITTILCAVASVSVCAPTASAAEQQTYVVSACKAGTLPAPTSSWTLREIVEPTLGAVPDGPTVQDSCLSGGLFEFELDGQHRGLRGIDWSFTAPPGTSVAAFRLWRHVATGGASPMDYSVRVGSNVVEEMHELSAWELGSSLFADAEKLTAASLHGSNVAIHFQCEESGFICGSHSRFRVAKSEVTLRDEISPTTEATWLAATGDLRLLFHDIGGGVESVVLRVDGIDRSVTRLGDAGCRPPFVNPTPCPLEGAIVLNVAPASLTDSAHLVEAVLSDVAGNRTIVGPFTLPVAASPSAATRPAATRPAPIPVGVLALSGRRTVRTRYSAPPVIRGTVKTAGGVAIARARVSVSEAPTIVTTDAKGRFSVKLARGVSRAVRFSYGDSVRTVKWSSPRRSG